MDVVSKVLDALRRDNDPSGFKKWLEPLTLIVLKENWHCMARVLVEVSDGKLGMCTAHARVGDQVVLLAGCPAPVILRTSYGKKFRLVGTVVLQDMIYGAGWPKDTNAAEMREFQLA